MIASSSRTTTAATIAWTRTRRRRSQVKVITEEEEEEEEEENNDLEGSIDWSQLDLSQLNLEEDFNDPITDLTTTTNKNVKKSNITNDGYDDRYTPRKPFTANHNKDTSMSMMMLLPADINVDRHHCSNITASTEGESSSFSWNDSSGYESSCRRSATTTCSIMGQSSSRIALELDKEEEDEEDEDSNDNDRQQQDDDDDEASLTLDDIQAFCMEDQVGVFDPAYRDDLPPPKVRTDYKGDSQNSFTLDDLCDLFDEDDECSESETEEDENDQVNHANYSDDEGSLGENFLLGPSPTTTSTRRRSTMKHNKRRSTMKTKNKRRSTTALVPLKGILKNNGSTKRASSLAMLLMEDSSMFQLSRNGRSMSRNNSNNNSYNNDGSLELWSDSFLLEGDDIQETSTDNLNGWDLMQQSFSQGQGRCALDLQALEDKHVDFHSVVVHSHARAVGDNPSVSEGVPLTLDWTVERTQTFASMEAYESDKRKQQLQLQKEEFLQDTSTKSHLSRNENSTTTRPQRLEAEQRLFLLLEAGIPLTEIQAAEQVVDKARHEREATKQSHLLLMGEGHAFWKAIQRMEEREQHVMERHGAALSSSSTSLLGMHPGLFSAG